MGYEKQSQLCVYVGEEKVIDVVMSPDSSLNADNLTTVMSNGKSAAGICFSTLVDKGLCEYD